MEFEKVEVKPTWLGLTSETGCAFKKPTVNKTYIKILARCLSYADRRIIYPGVKNPLMHQVRDLCRAGYLECFIADGKRNKYYYKTTMKGVDLLITALKNSQW